MAYLPAGDIPKTIRTEWRQKATIYKNDKNRVAIKATVKNNFSKRTFETEERTFLRVQTLFIKRNS